jgi:predicted O-linked N-acetylglucosamine transferase (SPINDLY family)
MRRELLDRSTMLLLGGAHDKALEILSVAVVRCPDDAAILTRHADALYQGERITEARDAYRRACLLDESEFQAWYGCGCAEFALGAYAGASVCLRRALALEPQDIDAHFCLGRALFYLGETDLAIEQFLFVAARGDARMRRLALRNLALFVPQSPSRGNAAILKARCEWASLEARIQRPRKVYPSRSHPRGTKLRIGYVSAFFDRHTYMKPVWGVLNSHDRSAFEIHLFLDGENPSSESGYRRHPDDTIHLIGDLSNKSAAERIAAAGIDVLVDLNGYSAAERLGLFMWKPAPVIAAWFNMYATSGISAFDYIIGDATVIPPGEERFYTERVLRVSGTHLAFSVSYRVPSVEPPPCLRCGQLTFGSLAPLYKITDHVISAWARILRGAPDARLLLKNKCMEDASNQAALYKRFARFGVPGERLVVEGPAEYFEFLKTYGRVDIALETFPYNGGTTAADALWQGVPTLAFYGDRWVSRMSCSILLAAGLGDWVTASLEAYIQRAIGLALSPATPAVLAALRARLREQLLASAACDTTTLCRELEGHYLSMARPHRAEPRSG